MKYISAHQPAYIPWLGFFDKINQVDEFVFMDDVQFEKNSFINRNKVLVNGTPTWLTIPVNTKNYKEKTIKEMEVANNNWQIKHLKTVEQSYKKAPYFDLVFPEFERALSSKSNFLVDFIYPFVFFALDRLEIKTNISFASKLSISSKKEEYVMELCRKMEADKFLFGKLGSDYAEPQKFKKEGIDILFQSFDPINIEKDIVYLSTYHFLFYFSVKEIKKIF